MAGGIKIRYRKSVYETAGDGSVLAKMSKHESSPAGLKKSSSLRRGMFGSSPGKKFATSMVMDPL